MTVALYEAADSHTKYRRMHKTQWYSHVSDVSELNSSFQTRIIPSVFPYIPSSTTFSVAPWSLRGLKSKCLLISTFDCNWFTVCSAAGPHFTAQVFLKTAALSVKHTKVVIIRHKRSSFWLVIKIVRTYGNKCVTLGKLIHAASFTSMFWTWTLTPAETLRD